MARKKPDRKINVRKKIGDAPSPSEPAPSDQEEQEETEPEPGEAISFPIVGIGASAGGLEAFERFFTNLPSEGVTYDTGIAFVLVQHLDPTHKSILSDLVRRYTRMKVFEVEDGMKVEPNCAYIIPPNRDMAIMHGVLHLIEPAASRGLRLPIDFLFRSLAQDQGERAICIVLSGTGTDGTLGLRAIKGEGGMAMVQDPDSARYDGMPRSAIATGLADYVLPPEKMPEQLINYVQLAYNHVAKEKEVATPKKTDWLQKVFVLLRDQTGHDFSYYKSNTIIRRIERRITVNQIDRAEDYMRYLQQNPAEIEMLFKELLIGVTNFFRNPEAFDLLEKLVIPTLFKDRPLSQPVRIWVPGCSTGEEAYSIAMLLREHMDEIEREYEIQIFATDIDTDAIESARVGAYPDSIAVDITPERLQRFFTQEGSTYQIRKSIRDMLIFASQNVVKDPPFSKIDLISCRNLLIYMGEDLQKKILSLFYYSLNQDGYLLLGNSETIGDLADLYEVADRKWKLFQRKGAKPSRWTVADFPAAALALGRFGPLAGAKPRRERKASLRDLAEGMLLERYSPTAVIINEKLETLYIHGRTGKYLEPAPGEASMNILEMARQGLKLELATAIRKAMTRKEAMQCDGLPVKINGNTQIVNLTVIPVLESPDQQGLIMVTFEDVAPQKPVETVESSSVPSEESSQRIAELEHELRSTREYLQTTIEELETANEELTSTNEELQSSNEELQSTNEELETSKEELQSVNEELVTVNSELETKIDELSRANDDMNNLLASTEIGTIFLDSHLRIQRFTPSATQFINLIQTDIGRPLGHIASNLMYDRLVQDAKNVLDTLIRKEIGIQTRDGIWLSTRIAPYRTTENVIEGVVITFINITEQKQGQDQLDRLMQTIEQSPSMVMIIDLGGNIEYVNPRFTQVTGYTFQEVAGKSFHLLQSGQHDPVWKAVTAGEEWRGEFHNKRKNGELYWELASFSPVRDADDKIARFVYIGQDITERKQAEIDLQQTREYAENIIDTVREPLLVLDADLKVISASRSFYSKFQVMPEETEEQFIYDLGNRQWDIPKLRELLENILPENTGFDDYEVEHEFQTIGRRKMILNARRIYDEGEYPQLILLAMEDVTDQA